MFKYLSSILLIALFFAGCSDNIQSPDTPGTSALNKIVVYQTLLSGSNEVPSVETPAGGIIILRYNESGGTLHYRLIVNNIFNITASHIHIGPEGVNGPVAVFLFGPDPGTELVNGILAEGVITGSDLIGPLAGGTLEDLIEHIENSNAYVNVHTNDGVPPTNTGPGDFPGGEIRGDL